MNLARMPGHRLHEDMLILAGLLLSDTVKITALLPSTSLMIICSAADWEYTG